MMKYDGIVIGLKQARGGGGGGGVYYQSLFPLLIRLPSAFAPLGNKEGEGRRRCLLPSGNWRGKNNALSGASGYDGINVIIIIIIKNDPSAPWAACPALRSRVQRGGSGVCGVHSMRTTAQPPQQPPHGLVNNNKPRPLPWPSA